MTKLISPEYYAVRDIQPIDIIESYNYQYGFSIGNAIKYIMRVNFESPKGELVKDIEKALWYLTWVLENSTEEYFGCSKGIPYAHIHNQWGDILPKYTLKALKHLTKVHNKNWLIPKYYLKRWDIERAAFNMRQLKLVYKHDS